MKHFLKENWFKLVIAICLLGAVGVATWYYGFKLPSQNGLKVQQAQQRWEDEQQTKKDAEAAKRQEESAKGLQLRTCLYRADTQRQENWTYSCLQLGTDNKGENCLLPTGQADQIDEWEKRDRDECYKLYN